MTRSILNTTVAFMLLISTSGLTFSLHYCHGVFQRYSVLSTVNACCPEQENPEKTPAHQSFDQEQCCENEFLRIGTTDDFIASLPDRDKVKSDHSFPFFAVTTYSINESGIHDPAKLWSGFREPPSTREVKLSLLQVFLL